MQQKEEGDIEKVVSSYVNPEKGVESVEEALAAGEKFEGAREATLLEQLKDFEYAWWHDRPGTFAATPQGDPIALVRKVFAD